MEVREFRMNDVYEAENIEITFGSLGELWVNVNGVCLLRAKKSDKILMDTSAVAFVNTGVPSVHLIVPKKD